MTKPKKMRNNLILIIILAVLVVVIALIHGTTKNTPTSPNIEVHITSSGFEPAALLVNENAQVTWINDTASPKVVAADPFKANTSLPGFKSQPLVESGTYSYTFTSAGTFGYHNELNPEQHAQVIVH